MWIGEQLVAEQQEEKDQNWDEQTKIDLQPEFSHDFTNHM